MYFVKNDDFITFFTIFQRWESPFFQKLQVAVGLASKSAQDRILCRRWQIDWPICGTGRQRSQRLAIHKKKVKISDSLGGSRFLTLLQ